MIILGLTGSIAMGKSATAQMFSDAGVPVFDSDAGVHALMAAKGKAVPMIEARFPGVTLDGAIDRRALGAKVFGDSEELKALEAILHPMVQAIQCAFLAENAEAGTNLVVLDIPLLFETGGAARCDKVAVVSAPYEVQRERVLARDGMTEQKFADILARQMPDAEKRKRADFVIPTDQGFELARNTVQDIIKKTENTNGHSLARKMAAF